MKNNKLNPIREYINTMKKYVKESNINPHLLGKDVYPDDANITLYYMTLKNLLLEYFHDDTNLDRTIEKLLWLLEINTGRKKYGFEYFIAGYYNRPGKCEEFGIVSNDFNSIRIIFSIATDCEQTLIIKYIIENEYVFDYTINEEYFLETRKNLSDELNNLLIIKDYLVEAKNEHIIHKDIIEREIYDFSYYETDKSFVREEKINFLLGLAG